MAFGRVVGSCCSRAAFCRADQEAGWRVGFNDDLRAEAGVVGGCQRSKNRARPVPCAEAEVIDSEQRGEINFSGAEIRSEKSADAKPAAAVGDAVADRDGEAGPGEIAADDAQVIGAAP